jgi:hypothetical protein
VEESEARGARNSCYCEVAQKSKEGTLRRAPVGEQPRNTMPKLPQKSQSPHHYANDSVSEKQGKDSGQLSHLQHNFSERTKIWSQNGTMPLPQIAVVLKMVTA